MILKHYLILAFIYSLTFKHQEHSLGKWVNTSQKKKKKKEPDPVPFCLSPTSLKEGSSQYNCPGAQFHFPPKDSHTHLACKNSSLLKGLCPHLFLLPQLPCPLPSKWPAWPRGSKVKFNKWFRLIFFGPENWAGLNSAR